MNRILLIVGVLGLAAPAIAKERSKEPAAAESQKATTIKDDETIRCIVERLEGQSRAKGWKIELKDLAGTAREFVATKGDRQEKGTVNVAKDYPNQGALRVYLVPRD